MKKMILFILSLLILLIIHFISNNNIKAMDNNNMLSDPFLQLPTEKSVRVVWFSEFEGKVNQVIYGKNLEYTAEATTFKLSKMKEDLNFNLNNNNEDNLLLSQEPIYRDIWRHEAIVNNLTSGNKIPYQVLSIREDNTEYKSNIFTLQPLP